MRFMSLYTLTSLFCIPIYMYINNDVKISPIETNRPMPRHSQPFALSVCGQPAPIPKHYRPMKPVSHVATFSLATFT